MSEPPNRRPDPRAYPPQQYPPQQYPPNPAAPYPVQPYRPARREPGEELRRDTEAALAARMELGPEYTEYVAAGLAERVEDLAQARAAELRYEAELARNEQAVEQIGRKRQFVLAIVSVVMGFPITGIATEIDPSLVGVAVSWVGIIGVNWIHARSIRKRN